MNIIVKSSLKVAIIVTSQYPLFVFYRAESIVVITHFPRDISLQIKFTGLYTRSIEVGDICVPESGGYHNVVSQSSRGVG